MTVPPSYNYFVVFADHKIIIHGGFFIIAPLKLFLAPRISGGFIVDKKSAGFITLQDFYNVNNWIDIQNN